MDRIANYIVELKSPVSLMRKFAARNLKRDFDERAVSPLIDALSDPEPEVRREAAETLGHIGREEAAGALQKACSDPDQKVAAAARKSVDKVLKSRKPQPRAGTKPGTRTRADLLREAMADSGSVVEEKPYGFKVTVRLTSGRKQQVRVAFDKPDPDGTKLIVMYTICGPASAAKYEWALSANARLSFGALAVRSGRDGREFILLDRVPEPGADPVDIRRRILSLSEKGDAIEKSLTGGDFN